MACYVDEECDWSDGSLGHSEHDNVHTGPDRMIDDPQEEYNDLFVSDTTDQCALPIGSPLPFSIFSRA